MKRCPECRRDYYDDTLSFCLDDGSRLLDGPAFGVPPSGGSYTDARDDEPATAILSEPGAVATGFRPDEAQTRPHNVATDQTAILRTGAEAEPQKNLNNSTEKRSFSARRTAKPLVALIVAVLILVGGFFGYRYFSPTKQIESIAVMPFVNESGNADVEYLSDGMTETLIRSLSQLPNLSVKARSSVFRYKGKETDVKTIGKELGVQAVLNGRVNQRGDGLSLNLELIDAQTENVIWTDQYDRKTADLVSLQNEIARDVSGKLKLKLSGGDQQKLAKNYTNDPEAYRLYLQGRFYLNKRVGKEYDKAENYLLQAIARDPNLAVGWVGLAEFVGQSDRAKAKEYIARALAIDNQLSDAHAALGLQLMLDYDFAASERELSRAIELDPDNVRAHQWNGTRLMMIGRYADSLAAYDRAIAIDPTLADIRNNRGACLVAAGRVDEGIEEIKKAIEIDPGYAWTFSHLSFVYRMKGDRAAAVEARARSAELVDRPDLAARLRESFRDRGWTAYLRTLLEQTSGLFPNPTRRASILCELGQKEEAIASLSDGAAKGEWWLFSIKYDPAFDPIRGDPRFQALLKKFDPP